MSKVLPQSISCVGNQPQRDGSLFIVSVWATYDARITWLEDAAGNWVRDVKEEPIAGTGRLQPEWTTGEWKPDPMGESHIGKGELLGGSVNIFSDGSAVQLEALVAASYEGRRAEVGCLQTYQIASKSGSGS